MTTMYDKEWYQKKLTAYSMELMYMANVDTFLVNNCQLARERKSGFVGCFTASEIVITDWLCYFGDIFVDANAPYETGGHDG